MDLLMCPVKSNPQSVEGLSIGSNNTGELRAIIGLFDYLLYYSGPDRGDYVVVYTDSQYVLSLLLGTSLPCTHPQLVSLAQQYYAALRAQYRVSIQKVPGHRGYPGNEIADLMAKKGVTQLGSLGRCSTSPSSPLSPPDIGFNNSSWAAIGVEAQDKFLFEKFETYDPLIPHLPISAKKPWITDNTLQLIADFQSTTFDDITSLKAARKQIKRRARKDKKIFVSTTLENDFHGSFGQQWEHIRSIRSDFKPKAAALFNVEGKLVSKTQQAKTFTDYLADKVWFSYVDPPVPVTDPSPAPVPKDAPFTMHELNLALRKIKSAKSPGPNGLVGKIYKHAPYILRMYLLDHFNLCFSQAQVPASWLGVPASWLFSEVVMIVKKFH